MSGFIQGEDRFQATLFPERLDDYVAEDSSVRVIDVFLDDLDLSGLGRANKVGYFYDPGTDITVNEPGRWTVKVVVTHDGETSAGPVQEPFPTGGVLGADNGVFHFYVVEKDAPQLDVNIPVTSWVEPGNGPIDVPVLAPDKLSNVMMYYTTVMPGFLLEENRTSNLTYTYNAPRLNLDFPNIDLEDIDSRTGVDTITMSFLVTGTNSGGNTVYRARQVLLQGEQLILPAQRSSNWMFGNGFE